MIQQDIKFSLPKPMKDLYLKTAYIDSNIQLLKKKSKTPLMSNIAECIRQGKQLNFEMKDLR